MVLIINFTIPLQVTLIFDFVPSWLASLVIFVGAVAVIYSVARDIAEKPIFSKETFTSTILFSVGVFLFLIPVFQQFTTPAAFGLFLLGRWVQGTTTIHTVNRIIFKGQFAAAEAVHRLQSNSSRRDSSLSITGTISGVISALFSRNKIAYFGAIYILMLAGIWLGAIVITEGSLIQSVGYDLRAIWTMVVLITSLFSALYSFSKVNLTTDVLSPGTKAGFILLIIGPEVFNFSLGLDLLSLVIGGMVYFAAIVWGAFRSIVISELILTDI